MTPDALRRADGGPSGVTLAGGRAHDLAGDAARLDEGGARPPRPTARHGLRRRRRAARRCRRAYHEALGVAHDPRVGHDRDEPARLGRAPLAAHAGARRRRPLDHVLASQGRVAPGVEIRIVREDGSHAPWDGETFGELQVRGNWIAACYYKDPAPEKFTDGWFRTGDVATIDAEGYIRIADRTKDVIKSGGEWISSVQLEGLLMGHPDVAEAAVIAVAHPQWDERPLACVVRRGRTPARQGGAPRAPATARREVVAARRRGLHRRGAEDLGRASSTRRCCASASRTTSWAPKALPPPHRPAEVSWLASRLS